MINLRVQIDQLPLAEPLVVRLCHSAKSATTENDAVLIDRSNGRLEYDLNGFSLVLHPDGGEDYDGDVILALPGQPSAHRLIRASSQHNTFLVTEQCDQLCVMCSQPPKKQHTDLFGQFAEAALLSPRGVVIGISGGEPLLHKSRLFDMLRAVSQARPDVTFHILTNGQHFQPSDVEAMLEIGTERVLWGVPLYSADPATHDEIVGKSGAFGQVAKGLGVLMSAGASVELRTVVMRQNVAGLADLADFVFTRLNFAHVWALMQMERIGYGRMNWQKSFYDSSADFAPIASAVDLSVARGINVSLYNFPLCSVPAAYRSYAPSTISDWKRKYLDFCSRCDRRAACGGFFEWYSHNEGFSALGPI
ncbi:His-Xaa-Ser system radical SAM maturase HxsC [Rhizobium leguminosarum]|uniref:His-Xaa-Ser system radical SAM maturase HxsC n=1 Tax=Rhizobium leguminosarum TaxID=384 RepID=UPI001C9873BD|nr:His-Xaa-Ser system radical SAM maturase HxsC [Rhizobium leguminosarum]MBY5401041.1 His-Xaa-Ser system radical SAM maturase HxsC [Rhizobium leguminosarum]